MKEYKNLKYYLNQDFPIKGVTFVDFTPTFYDFNNFFKVIVELSSLVKDDFDYIAAPDARGFLWGMALANHLKIGIIPIRKAGKLPNENIQDKYEYVTEYSKTTLDLPLVDLKGKKVLFVDDVYATGGTYEAVKNMVNNAGGTLNQGIVLYNVMINNNNDIDYLVSSKELF